MDTALSGDVKYLRRKEALYYVLRAFTNLFDSFPSQLITGVPLIPLGSSTVYNLAYALWEAQAKAQDQLTEHLSNVSKTYGLFFFLFCLSFLDEIVRKSCLSQCLMIWHTYDMWDVCMRYIYAYIILGQVSLQDLVVQNKTGVPVGLPQELQ